MNVRTVLGVFVTMAAVVALAAGSRVPWQWTDDERAVVRLSWRAPALRIEECRPLTEEEKAARPVHMRRDSTCVGRGVDFRLEVDLDGRPVVRDTIAGSAEIGDRPVAIRREIPVEPGGRSLTVRFDPLEGSSRPSRLEETLDLAPREIAVVTRAEGELVVRRRQ